MNSSNVLFKEKSETDLTIKILSFSYSKVFRDQTVDFSIKKSLPTYHLSPETILLQNETKGDLWSCGILLYFLCFGKLPFSDLPTKNDNWEIPLNEFSIELNNFLKKLIVKEMQERYSAIEALEDPWIKKYEKNQLAMEVPKSVYENLKACYVRTNFF